MYQIKSWLIIILVISIVIAACSPTEEVTENSESELTPAIDPQLTLPAIQEQQVIDADEYEGGKIEWYEDPNLMMGVSLAMFADDVTGVGALNDPVAVVLLAYGAFLVYQNSPVIAENASIIVDGTQELRNWVSDAVAQQLSLEAAYTSIRQSDPDALTTSPAFFSPNEGEMSIKSGNRRLTISWKTAGEDGCNFRAEWTDGDETFKKNYPTRFPCKPIGMLSFLDKLLPLLLMDFGEEGTWFIDGIRTLTLSFVR